MPVYITLLGYDVLLTAQNFPDDTQITEKATYLQSAVVSYLANATNTTGANITGLSNQKVVSIGPYGGTGGSTWDDYSQIVQARGLNKYVEKIQLRSGTELDNIQFFLLNN